MPTTRMGSSLAVDDVNAYWNDNPSGGTSTIYQCALSGCNAAGPTSTVVRRSVVLDVPPGPPSSVYFSTFFATIERLDTDGSVVPILPGTLGVDSFTSLKLASDALYYTSTTPDGGGESVSRCSLPACTNPIHFPPGAPSPNALALGEASAFYWRTGLLFRQSTSLSMQRRHGHSGAAQARTEGVLIHAFLTGHVNGVAPQLLHTKPLRARAAAEDQRRLGQHGCFTPGSAAVGGLAVDNLYAYFGGGGPNAVYFSPITGGGIAARFGGKDSSISGIVTDGTTVYWSEMGPATYGIYSCPRTGCANPTR